MDAPPPTAKQAVAEIRAALAANDRKRAIDLAVAAMSRDVYPPLVLRMVAEGLEEDGHVDDALAIFNRAQFEAPKETEFKIAFASALIRHAAEDQALAPLDAVLTREPAHFDALMLKGRAALGLKDLEGARAAFERAKAAKPHRDEPLVELAVIASRRGDLEGARAAGEHALALNPGAALAAVAMARADLAEGKAGDARTRLEGARAFPRLSDGDRAEVLTYLGDALDALNHPAEAFALWREREAILRSSRVQALARGVGEQHIVLARRLAAWFGALPQGTWQGAPSAENDTPKDVAGHAFVLSFPRSGTTLLEQVLAGHPSVVALDESAALPLAADHLITDEAGLAKLVNLTAHEAAACREAYWTQVRRETGGELSGRFLVDKNPLNSVRLPVIAKLFPRAKVIFALRDPRDVALSGYRRLYYSKMLEFHTLEGTARFYDAVQRLMEIYRAGLGMEIHTLRHEVLVADFEAQARGALAFLGLGWDPAVLDFANRPVMSSTPSAAQVTQGLNAEGVGQWKRYLTELTPVLPILEPWAAHFGYPPAPAVPRKAPAARRKPPTKTDPAAAPAIAAILAELTAGRLPGAMAKAEEALARGLSDPLFHRLRGVRAQQEGRLDLAIDDFETALAQAGEDGPVLNALGLCLARAGRVTEGLARLDRALELDPRVAPTHYNRGWALEVLGDVAGARLAYEAALALDPRHAQALANLAILAARAADWPRARELATRALALDPASPAAATALARAEAATGEAEAARARLASILASRRADPHERAVASAALGDVLDQLGQPSEAFDAYSQGAGLLRDLYAGRFAGRESTTAFAARLTDATGRLDPAQWRRGEATAATQGPTGHVFLLGFPRSGTTMLGQALASHPAAVTLDERPTLSDAAEAFLLPPGGLERLAATPSPDLQPFRDAYWRRVREGGAVPEGRVFIDKLPMNTLGIPLIARLFPDARILFLRRDPRDVVLSCLRRQFVIDATTVDLLGLDSAARLYDQMMRLMEAYRRALDVDLREQGYEDLVQNFEAQMRQICDFVGLDFDPVMADFAGRAGLVATPSAAQIARGLNTEGVGVWRRYRDFLAPVMESLTPWVSRFGYDADQEPKGA